MKKNIILTSADLENSPEQKGIVSFESDGKETHVCLKTFNLKKINGKLMLGIQQNKIFFKTEINEFKSNSEFKINAPINLNDKLSCVVIDVLNETASPLIWGSNETSKVWQNSFLFHDKEEDDIESLDNSNVYERDEDIEAIVDNAISKLDTSFEDEIIKPEEEQDILDDTFYSTIKNQVDELLNNYEQEKALEVIIPNSKFVKVDYEQNGDYYIFGVIYEDDKIKYVVYGLPGEYGIKPEDEYSNYYQWLPLNADNPEGFGYYLMYQDAKNGEAIKIEII